MSAVISECGRYRYRLERDVSMTGSVYAYFGVNPSTADATVDDATVRKWIGFTKVFGGRGFIVGNVFAFRSTDVKALHTKHQVVGPENFAHLERIAQDADVLVPCWGDRGKVPKSLHHHIDQTLAFLRSMKKPVMCFGLTAGGDPKHPLMLGYDTLLANFGATP